MSKKIVPITIDEWITDAFSITNDKPENSFTIDDVVKKTNGNSHTIQGRLAFLVRSGKLVKGKFIKDGKHCNWYLPIELSKK